MICALASAQYGKKTASGVLKKRRTDLVEKTRVLHPASKQKPSYHSAISSKCLFFCASVTQAALT